VERSEALTAQRAALPVLDIADQLAAEAKTLRGSR
jgi:hypothetical protein